MKTEEVWEQYELMVYKYCHSFNKSTGIAFDDLLGVAKVKFMKIYNKYSDREINEIGKILYKSIKNELIDYIKSEFKNRNEELPEDYKLSDYTVFEVMRFDSLKGELSKESKEVVEYVIKENISNRTEVTKVLRNKGYSYPTIWNCIKEIKKVLRNF